MTSIAETPSTVALPGSVRAVVVTPSDVPEMNRSERIGFWMYAAMGTFCAAVPFAAAVTAIVS